MGKYTTQLRYLMATNYNLGMQSYPIFDENYRTALNNKILAHLKQELLEMEAKTMQQEPSASDGGDING